jgi:hypothetical protein
VTTALVVFAVVVGLLRLLLMQGEIARLCHRVAILHQYVKHVVAIAEARGPGGTGAPLSAAHRI